LNSDTGGTALATITKGDKDVERKLLQLEESVRVKSNDMKQLSRTNASLEEQVVQLQQKLLLSKVKIGQQVQADDDVLETRDFKKRCSDLETTLRRKTREFDRLERKIQNQSLLEEELSTTNIKLKLSQDQIEKFKHTESLYHSLLNEKSEWSVLFQGIINENDESSLESINELKNIQKVSSSSDINPSAVLRALGSIQKKYVLLLKSDHDLSESNKDLVKRLTVLDELLVKITDEKKGSDYQIERASSRLRLAQQQTKLYEGEVVSLRALLQSFDVEFSIGRPSDSTLLKMKDEVIASLRDVIEKCRSEAKSLSIQNENLMADRDALIEIDNLVNKKGLTVDTFQGGIDKEGGSRESILKDELIALQMFTGVDFVPGKTKVLHLSDNPCSQALGSRANTGTSSLPREHLRRLLREAVKGGPPGVISVGGMDRSGENELFREDSEGGDISVAHNGTSMSAGASSTIADSNKLNQRLKEMFKDRITSFREAVYLLTGYKVDLYAADTTTGGHARLRLRSMYADNPEDSLLFQWRGDKLELMETPFASKLDSKLFTYLSTCNSVPCFLSNVTLDLFDNQTFLP
jgi:mitotic spindle assembly checkpoint protein MAD1